MKPISICLFISALILTACGRQNLPEAGSWRAWLVPDTSKPNLEIPFNLDIIRSEDNAITAKILNGDEKINIDEITVLNDSIHFRLPVFEGTIDAVMKSKRLDGTYTHRAGGRSWTAAFHADYGITDRFPALTGAPAGNVSGRWEVEAGPEGRAEKQIAEFRQEGSRVMCTFLTTTGDYRYLEGKMGGNHLIVSAFDGAHALVFQADLASGDTLKNGTFCGGPSWKGEWKAFRNDTVSLPDPTTLTYLKPGYEKLEFSFPGDDGKPVSLSDHMFKGKVVIVQIIGSWCPNCMDETRYYSSVYNELNSKGLEIIALCYESPDRVKSLGAIKRFRDNIGARYTFLYAGESNKRKAGETLPMLNRILSFPTSIFIDRTGNVREVFTGFSGPGTGSHNTELTGRMRKLIDLLISEKTME